MTTREVVLEGGSPWGFRMHGGVDVQQPLRISRVNPGSKAAVKGVREGDIITSINNQPTRDITNADANVLLKKSGDTLKLGLNEDCSGSPKRRQYKTVQQETHSESIERSSTSKTSYSSSTSVTINRTQSDPNEPQNPPSTKLNGQLEKNGDPENGIISQRSTISSSCSSSPSTAPHLAEAQGCTRAGKEARRISRALSRNRHQGSSSLLHEIDSALIIARGFLLGRGVWSPGQKPSEEQPQRSTHESQNQQKNDEPIPPVWTPRSAGSSPTVERKEFRPVNFESPVLGRKHKPKVESSAPPDSSSGKPPWQVPDGSSDVGVALSSSLERRIPTSHSAPASGFTEFSTPRLPRAQNPTITLLQKAREGQLPRGASYIQAEPSYSYRTPDDRPPLRGPGEVLYQIKNEYTSESDSERPRKMADLGPRKYEIGIGPTTKDGMPLVLRSEVKDGNQSRWYKRMYDTIHKQKPDREYVTVRYKQRRARYPYASGYFSEPEHSAFSADYYDSDGTASDNKYATLDRRRIQPSNDKENDYYMSSTIPRDIANSDIIKHGQDVYRNQPGRIENYVPGRSSISEKEAKEWWDEVMDIFDGHLEQQKSVPQPRSFINQALKESGYESDSTLVFRRREDAVQQLSPSEQREAYKNIQKGGDVPLHGLRKLAPERPKESPRKYVENEVTIHYKSPIRQEVKESLSEEELSRRQAEHMKRVYEEERRRKYLQELQDMNSRRHTDNFIPSQKSPIPLNRYDDFPSEDSPKIKPRPRSPEPRLVARALYNFVGQSARELTFRKGDIIYVRRQVDKNWYEGEHNAMIGLFPANYAEIIPYDGLKSTPRRNHEGQARAKFNFIAQTHLELSLAKGELVVVTRRVDDNWFEGRIGGRKGIFPVSYVEILIDPSNAPATTPVSGGKPVASPAAHSMLLNGSAGGKESMGSHSYTPSMPYQQHFTSSYRAKPVQISGGNYGSLTKSMPNSKNPINEALHIDTHSEPVPYRALYKYRPQNDDELELMEGDVVYVLEKCDDGWYVGSSQRSGAFGTFPGNYVERI